MPDEKGKKTSSRSRDRKPDGVIQAVPDDGNVIDNAEVPGSVNPLLHNPQQVEASGSDGGSDGGSESSERSDSEAESSPQTSAEPESTE